MAYQCVPFDPEWAKGGECPDIKAMYRRPARDKYLRPLRAPDGTPRWDVIGPLPIQRHADFAAKGYVYITLASEGDLMNHRVIKSLRARGLDPQSFRNGPGRRVWDPEVYQADAAQQDAQDYADLEALVKEFGSDAVVKIKRQADPTFELPEALRGKRKGAAA